MLENYSSLCRAKRMAAVVGGGKEIKQEPPLLLDEAERDGRSGNRYMRPTVPGGEGKIIK